MNTLTAAIDNISLWHIFASHWNWLFVLLFCGGTTVSVRARR